MPGSPGTKAAQWTRVAARLREDIIGGTLRLGQRLPSEAELSARYRVSRGTIVRALETLRGEGLIMTTHGQGSVVAWVPVVAVIRVGPQDMVVARVPDDEDRDALGMAAGVPVLVVTRPGAGPPEVYDGAVTVVRGA